VNLSKTLRAWLAVTIVVLALAVVVLWSYGRGGGPLPQAFSFLSASHYDPLGESDSQEVALRTMRLAGFERAVAGAQEGSALLRIEMPRVTTAADFEIAWQIGYSTLAVAYPDADTYIIQLFEDTHGILELAGPGEAIRQAISTDDALALKEATEFTFLRDGPRSDTPSSEGEGTPIGDPGWWDYVLRGFGGGAVRTAVGMPDSLLDPAYGLANADPIGAQSLPKDSRAVDRDVSGAYLDAKNAAAGVRSIESSTGLRAAAGAMRDAVGGIPAPEPGKAAEAYARRIVAALNGRANAESEIISDVESIASSGVEPPSAQVLELRTLASAAEAISAPRPFGSLLQGVVALARDVATTPLQDNLGSHNAVLVAALSPSAPPEALAATAFDREPSADISVDSLDSGTEPTTTVAALFANREQSVTWQTADGPRALEPQDLRAYRRADGTLFWVASADTGLALRDATLNGWAFSTPMVAIIDAANVGRWLAVFPVQVSP